MVARRARFDALLVRLKNGAGTETEVDCVGWATPWHWFIQATPFLGAHTLNPKPRELNPKNPKGSKP